MTVNRQKGDTVQQSFRELDDLVLFLKGLVLVRGLREEQGADPGELRMYESEIERVRGRLPRTVPAGAAACAVAA